MDMSQAHSPQLDYNCQELFRELAERRERFEIYLGAKGMEEKK